MKKSIYVVVAMLTFGIAHAGEQLSSDALKELLTDKTVTGEHFRHGLTKTYYGTDGSVQSESDSGKQRVGKWWIDEDSNKRCIRWDHKNKDFCHYIEKNGDGSYTIIHGKKGKRLVEIKSLQEGKHL